LGSVNLGEDFMKRFGQAAVAAVALMATAKVASAQLPGILPYSPVETGSGIYAAADYGKPSDDLGGGTAYALTGGLGFSSFGFSVSAGARDPGGTGIGSSTSYGARVGMKLFGGGLNPLSVGLQVGGSQTKNIGAGGTSASYLAPGAWVKVNLPMIKPWGQVYYLTGTDLPATAEKEARFVVGVNLNLLVGFGLHAAYDWGNTGNIWGVGAHFNFRLPGVPLVPGV
jgi:hypothetical protein